jgi:hypothetical protein
MIPKGLIDVELTIQDTIEQTRTYKLSETNIQGFTDDLGALEQYIYKVLSTEKYEFPIYSFNFGIELESLIGRDPAYVKVELKRRIKNCLLQDSRITSVENFKFTITGDEALCTFDVVSIYGEIEITKEVNV